MVTVPIESVKQKAARFHVGCFFLCLGEQKESEEAPLSQLRQALVEHLKKVYSAYYDIESIEDDSGLQALCAYHMRDSQYVLVKRAELWAAESHEYLYLWSLEQLNGPALEKIYGRVLENGEPRIKPHAQHMYTYLTAVVLYDRADPETLAQLKKLKKRREYKLSLHGRMEFRIAAVDVSTGEITVNRSGKTIQKDLKRLTERVIARDDKGEEKTQ